MPIVPSARPAGVSMGGVPGAKFDTPAVDVLDARMPAPTLSAPELATPQLQARLMRPEIKDPNAIRTVELSDRGARETMQMGGQLAGLGQDIGRAVLDMQIKTNAAVADDALNDAREAAAKITFGQKDPQSGQIVGGYRNTKGYDAIKRPSGKSLDAEVGEQYDKVVKDIIAAKITNPVQRQAFLAQANDIGAQLRQGAMVHQSEQFNSYYSGVYTAQVKNLTTQFSTLDPGDLDSQKKTMDQIDGAVGSLAVHNGASAQELAVGQRAAHSEAVNGLFEQAMTGKKYATAQALLNQWSDKIDPNVAAKMKSALDGHVSIQVGEQTADDIWSHWAAPAFNAGDADRGYNIVLGLESRGRQVGDDGKLIRSPKGAGGIGQITQDTAEMVAKKLGKPELADLAFQPTKAGEAANRVLSRAYWSQLVTQFKGDTLKAAAAYNAGPGWLTGGKDTKGNAIEGALNQAARTGQDWRTFLPAETQKYVSDFTKSFGSGEGAPPRPSRSDLYAQLDARTDDPDVRRAGRAKLDLYFSNAEQDERSNRDDAYAEGIRVVEGSGGNINAVSPELKAKIKPEQFAQLEAHAQHVAENRDQPTDMAAYYQLTDDKTLKGLTQAQLWAYRPMLSTEDFRSVANHWSDLQKPIAGKDPASLDTSSIKEVVDTRLRFLGLDPSPKDTDKPGQARIGAINQFVRDAILTRQAQTGSKMEYKDIEQTINLLFSRSQPFRNTVMGVTVGAGRQNVMTSQLKDIPADTRQRITQTLQKAGIAKPTEVQVLDAYWRSTFFK